MNNLSIRQKILIAMITPVIALGIILMLVVYNSTKASIDAATTMVSYSTLEDSKDVVQNYVDIAYSAISNIYNNAEGNDEEAKQQALAILQGIRFEDDNYVFVYQYDGMNLASGGIETVEGRNLMDMTDVNDKPIIKDLIDRAQSGGGHYQYVWYNPTTEEDEPKMSYVIGLEKWGWMLGTGIYLNHINENISFLKEEINSEANGALVTQFITGVVITIITAVLGIFIAQIIANPIRLMTEMMDQVSHGDLTPRMKQVSDPEIGAFAHNFNLLLDKIHQILSGVSSTANQLSGSASQLSQISQDTYDAISKQDKQTVSIASSVQNMATHASDIAACGDEVKNSACNAESKANESHKSVEKNLTSVKLLVDEISQAAQAVSAVEKRTDEIQSMLEVIHSVTEQTNLLALNAAIEAARAGEQGRGFAVVADEVRSLAMRSAESAEEIRRIIEGLINDTQSAVKTMDESRGRSEDNLENSTKVTGSLDTINEAVQSILEKSAYIAEVSDEQNTTAQEIATNIDSIKDISATSAERMKQTLDASQQLDKLSKGLLEDIQFFKLG